MPSGPTSISESERPGGARAFWAQVAEGGHQPLRRYALAFALALTVVIGVVDYKTGTQVSMLVFYFLPVAIGVAATGWKTGVSIAVLSVVTWLISDFAAGARYISPLIPCWNAAIALGTYLVLVWLLASLLTLHRELEQRVRQRTAALRDEMAERERLEKAMLDIVERERLNIGRDLHDGLGQHLTGTALLAQAAARDLEERAAAEAPLVTKVVNLIEQGIEQTRRLSRGLLAVGIEKDGLVAACAELAATTQEQFRIACHFRVDGDPLLGDTGTATHLYCIVQEAVRNAARHAGAKRIEIRIAAGADGITCSVRDDGCGIPARPGNPGLGLRIMAHRAAIIGADFALSAPADGGTQVRCHLPA